MKAEVYPGILTHTLEEYLSHLAMIEESDATWAHIDIMDGQFVPNIGVMPHEFMSIPTRLKLEAHMMVYHPERYYSDLSVAGVSRVLIHREAYESFDECSAALKHAADYFSEVGLVLNLDTPLEPYAELPIQAIQCMGIVPGASGRALVDDVYDKIKNVGGQKLPAVIAVDGGVDADNIRLLQAAGVQRFVISSRMYVANNVPQNFTHFIQLLTGGAQYEESTNRN
jgi:ribulose-phosphate 3-epimerase